MGLKLFSVDPDLLRNVDEKAQIVEFQKSSKNKPILIYSSDARRYRCILLSKALTRNNTLRFICNQTHCPTKISIQKRFPFAPNFPDFWKPENWKLLPESQSGKHACQDPANKMSQKHPITEKRMALPTNFTVSFSSD